MGRQGTRLTRQETEFAKLVAVEGKSYAAAFRAAYPPKQPGRSAEAERVGGKKIARRPLVQERMAELRAQIEASNPEELRSMATGALARILAGQSDPGLRLVAISTLRYLDAQDRAAARNEREAFRMISARLATVDALEGRTTKPARSTAAKPHVEERPPANIDQIIDEIGALIAEQQADRDLEPPAVPEMDSRPDNPPQAAGEEATVKESGFQWVRRPGHFGRGGWMRLPNPR